MKLPIRPFIQLLACLIFPLSLLADPGASLTVQVIRYDATLADREARFVIDLDLEATDKGETILPLFTGDVAMLTTKLPANLRLTREDNQYRITAEKPGHYKFKVELVAKITRTEPWNQVSFAGPTAAIGSVTAQAAGADVELQLLTGTLQDSTVKDGVTRVRGFLGAEHQVSIRWQSKSAEVARKALLTCETTAAIQVTPTVVKYNTSLRYEILQGNASRLLVTLPAAQALTKLIGENVRDWQIKTEGGQQALTVEFIKPIERGYALTLLSEQTLESAAATAAIAPPQPQEVERETGLLTVAAEDVLVETDSVSGLRQVNATAGALAAFQFYSRPFALVLKLRRIEPVLNSSDRVTVRLEESRLLVAHALMVTVEKAGIYSLELTTPAGFAVADVHGDGIEDSKTTASKLVLTFNSRVLGSRRVDVQLERPLKAEGLSYSNLVVTPLRLIGAVRETAQIGAACAAGLQLKTVTGGLTGVREIPVNRLPSHTDESLAYNTDQADWRLSLAAERLAPRITADVFNLVTIGDGLLGGSATIRYAILNQGVQEFRVKVPVRWKNIEFTGPNIRRKEQQDDVWVISLQEKAWGGYTLVVTYDYQFDSHKASLAIGGIHCEGVERETGSLAITSAADLQIQEEKKTGTTPAEAATSPIDVTALDRIDEGELADNDRALITRPVLMAYRYAGRDYDLNLAVTRFDEMPVLDAAADRTQLTTVITEDGQMLTQASFMVKNNDRQFQSFTLPEGAEFWSCYISGQAAKAERSGNRLLVPLPRQLNRDQAFPVDIVYAEKIAALKSRFPHRLELAAPQTDMQTTYAEWELYIPTSLHLDGFGGNMIVARGTTYGLRDAWKEFVRFYDMLYQQSEMLTVAFLVCLLLVGIVVAAIWRGWRGFLAVLAALVVLLLLAGMLMPALASSSLKARRAQSVNNLRQIGMGLAQYTSDHAGQMPATLDDIKEFVGSEKVFTDVVTEQAFVYVGAGSKWQAGGGREIVTYSPVDRGGRSVLFSDGHAEWVASEQFDELLARTDVNNDQILSLNGGSAYDVSDSGKAIVENNLSTNATTVIGGGIITSGGMLHSGGGGGGSGFIGTNGELYSGVIVGNGSSNNMASFGRWDVGIDEERGATMATAAEATITVGNSGQLASPASSIPSALVSGIRPIRIDIPKTGQRFVFTKVLNVRAEPLLVQAMTMEQAIFTTARGLAQAAAFVIGLGLTWWQWRRARPSNLLLTAGLALWLGAVVSLLISWRALHVAMILAVPLVVLAICVRLAMKIWKRKRTDQGPRDESGPVTPASVPPIVAAIVVLLLAGSVAHAQTPENSVSILSATYTGTVRALDAQETARAGQFEAVLVLDATGNNQTVHLLNDDVAVDDFSATPASVKLVRESHGVSVFIPRKGSATVHLKFLVKATGDVESRQVGFAIPPSLASRVAVTLDEPDAQVDVPTAVSFKTSTAGQQTMVEAVLGASERVELTWTPRMKRAADMATTVFCNTAGQVTIAGGAVDVHAIFDYQVTQGELRQMRVALPAGQRLMRVEGDSMRTWKLDGQTLLVELVKGVTPSYRLTVETEKAAAVEALSTNDLLQIELPHALDVKRETGLIALRTADELSVSVADQKGLQKVDVEEFTSVAPASDIASVYRFLNPEFQLSVRVAPVQSQVEALVHNQFRVTTEQIALHVIVDYAIKRLGVFSLRLALPDDYRVDAVTGPNVAQWVEKTGTPRVLEVTLKERTIGAFNLAVDLARNLKELPKSLELTGAQPLGVEKLNGFVSAMAEEGVQIKTESLAGITEVPAALLPGAPQGAGLLGFKMLPSDSGTVPASWKLTVSTEQVESWVRAEVMNTVTLSDVLVSGRSVIRYDIANAPTKEFRVRVPATFHNVEVVGANIRRKDHDEPTGEWQVELQNKVHGIYELTVTWDMPWDAKSGALDVVGVEVPGVERETGSIAIVAPSKLRVEAKSMTEDLVRIDVQDLPDWINRAGSETPVMAYRYLRPGFKLGLAIQRFDEAEVLQALVDNVRLTTVVSEDGEMMTEMTLAVRNNARQYLEISLPPGTTNVWSAFVGGQPVRPSVRNGKLLLPMERSQGEAPVPVEVTYVGSSLFPRGSGAVALVSPALDVPLKNARWELYLPPDYAYGDFAGTMQREAAPATAQTSAPVVHSYGLREYAYEETQKQIAQRTEAQTILSNVRDQLASGNVKGANDYFNQARGNAAAVNAGEYKSLEQNLNRARAGNIIHGQQLIVAQNGGQPSAGNVSWNLANELSIGQLPVAPAEREADEEAAEQQAAKVQAAQEVTVTKAVPLRLNLPKRGVYFSFTQVLQTELSKPMSVQFNATNERGHSWLSRIILGGAAVLALWGLVTMTMIRRQS